MVEKISQFEGFDMDVSLPIRPDTGRAPLPLSPTTHTDQKLRDAAKELEATFLAEMLKSAGLGELPETFGGGAGEEQFSSFLRLEQARDMVAAGGIGLAETLFNAMKDQSHGVV